MTDSEIREHLLLQVAHAIARVERHFEEGRLSYDDIHSLHLAAHAAGLDEMRRQHGSPVQPGSEAGR